MPFEHGRDCRVALVLHLQLVLLSNASSRSTCKTCSCVEAASLAYILARVLAPEKMRSFRARSMTLIFIILYTLYTLSSSAAPDVSDYCMETAGKTYCVPVVTVLGLPKAATSAITLYLMEHPQLQLMHGEKESCPSGDSFSVSSALLKSRGCEHVCNC